MTGEAGSYDYIIVGAGSAGCVLAYRLSENPCHRVLLIEAGPPDTSAFIHMPMGFTKVLANKELVWTYPIEPEGGMNKPEIWLRGKTLGGSSSVNGMMYVRGQPRDFDDWAANGAPGWDWAHIGKCFEAVENHELGATEGRGGAGRLRVSLTQNDRNPVLRGAIAAGEALGLPYKQDINIPGDQQGIGYFPRTIHKGRRWSSAKAFLEPARKRPNLTILTGVQVDRVLFQGRRATGLACRTGGAARNFHGREIVLSAGALNTPKLLQLSGIGPAEWLREAGVAVLHDSPGVGRNLREHRLLMLQYRLKIRQSYNLALRGWRLYANALRYFTTRSGPLAGSGYDVGAFFRTRPELERPDAQMLMTPATLDYSAKTLQLEAEPGMQAFGYALRPESQGFLRIRNPDPDTAPMIRANYLTAEYDQRVSVALFRFIRRLFEHPAVAPLIERETGPNAGVRTDEEIIAAFKGRGGSSYHTIGTCRMGQDEAAVVDEKLRVRGVQGLRVMDISVMPTMISGNTNGPAMAMAWRAADLILQAD